MTIELRSYQQKAVDDLRSGIREGHWKQVLCGGTGIGKTHIAAWFMQEALERDRRAAFLCDRVALVDQTSTAFHELGIPHGVIQAENTYGRDELIQVCSAQSIEKRGFWPGLNLLVVDEAHRQRKATVEFLKNWKGITIGLTATPFSDGMAETYSNIVNTPPVVEMIRNEWLVPVECYEAKRLIDMKGARKKAGGEWSDRAAEERATVVIGDVLSLWEEKTREVFGRPVKTLFFGPTVAYCERLCDEFQKAGYDFRMSSYLDRDTDKVKALVDAFKRNEFLGLGSVDKFCLDDESEILTADGWKGIDAISESDDVANWWEDGRVTFERPSAVHRRRVDAGEEWVSYSDRLRVTGNHRLVVRHQGYNWKVDRAENLVGRKRELPISGFSEPQHFDMTTYEETRRDALRRTAPHELSLDDCRFIGFWLGDGSVSKRSTGGLLYSASQSMRYPEIVSWFDSLLSRMRLDHGRRVVKRKGAMTADAVGWSFGRGTGFGSQRRNGLYRLEPYLDKDGSELLWGLDGDQFEALIEGLNLADGVHRVRHIKIASANRRFLDLIQAVAVCRGWRASLRPIRKAANENQRDACSLTLKRGHEAMLLGGRGVGFASTPVRPGERAWCVTVPSGFIVTRRRGRVVVVGNSTGFDVPDVLCLIAARPFNKSFTAWMQQLGRLMRIAPGKTFGLLLDYTGNYIGFYSDMVEFYRNGVDSLRSAKRDKERERKPRDEYEPVCANCGFVMKPGAEFCPRCGTERKRRKSNTEVSAGRMEKLEGITADLGKHLDPDSDEWTWLHVCRVATNRHPENEEKARKFAYAQYKNLKGDFPPRHLKFARDYQIPDEGIRRAVMYQLVRYFKGKGGRKKK